MKLWAKILKTGFKSEYVFVFGPSFYFARF